jgi:hypothetical protein
MPGDRRVSYLSCTLCNAHDTVALLLQDSLQVLEEAMGALDGKWHLRDQHSINNTCSTVCDSVGVSIRAWSDAVSSSICNMCKYKTC